MVCKSKTNKAISSNRKAGGISIPKLDGKLDEINFLTEFAHALPENTYLKSLFSDELIGYATEKIRSDFLPNIYEELQGAWDDRMRMAGEVGQLKEVLSLKDAEYKELEQELKSIMEESRRRMNELHEERVTNHALRAEIDQLRNLNEQLQKQIDGLKVKLYDLEHPEGVVS